MDARSASYSKKKLRRFALIFSIALVFLFGVVPFLRHPSDGINVAILSLGISIALLALISPYSLRKPYIYWLKAGDFLASLNSKIILGIFFFVIISPLAILARIARNMLRLAARRSGPNSYRIAPATQISSFSEQH